jgi:P pilus assembly chaperone PapD
VFAAPAAPAPRTPPPLAWNASVDRASGLATLTAANPGVRRVRLSELSYRAGGPSINLAQGLAGYVLAGESWSCRFRLTGDPASIDVEAMTENGKVGATVPLAYR